MPAACGTAHDMAEAEAAAAAAAAMAAAEAAAAEEYASEPPLEWARNGGIGARETMRPPTAEGGNSEAEVVDAANDEVVATVACRCEYFLRWLMLFLRHRLAE